MQIVITISRWVAFIAWVVIGIFTLKAKAQSVLYMKVQYGFAWSMLIIHLFIWATGA